MGSMKLTDSVERKSIGFGGIKSDNGNKTDVTVTDLPLTQLWKKN